MPIKIEAAARLKAGWFDALSDAAKKAYKKLHPNSKVGDGRTANGTGAHPDRIKRAEEIHKKHKEKYGKHRDAMHDKSSDKDWEKHDRALENLERSRDRLAKLKRGKG
jgi:hypothetical protein